VGRFVSFMFGDLKQLFFNPGPLLPEDRIPVNKKGKAEAWLAAHR